MEKESESEDSSGRRGFVRKIMGLVAAGGIASVLLGRQVEKASAANQGEVWFDDGAGSHLTDSAFFWDNTNKLLGVGTSGPSALLHVSGSSPNILMGDSANTITDGKIGATISGGGESGVNGANQVTQDFGTVIGGHGNTAGGHSSTVSGGQSNTASGEKSTVGGGLGNWATNSYSAVGGGIGNGASGNSSTVGGGKVNQASGTSSTVPGGELNTAAAPYSFAAGRRAKVNAAHTGASLFADCSDDIADFNSVAANEFAVRCTGGARFVTAIDGSGNPLKSVVIDQNSQLGVGTAAPLAALHVSGTTPNILMGDSANTISSGVIGGTISGGGEESLINQVTDNYGTVGGGHKNASGGDATVGGGNGNTASGERSTVGGGHSNTASGDSSTVSGGVTNQASGLLSTVGGGQSNKASSEMSTVGGGDANVASGYASTVGGGENNTAAGAYSFAAGKRGVIDATHAGAFLYADSRDFDFNSVAANEFAVRCTGGARFVTAIDPSTGNPTATTVIDPSGRLGIGPTGKLGIGTTAPVTALHIKSASSNPAVRIENQNNHVGEFIYCYSSSHIPFFSGRRARGTMAAPAAVQADDALMRYGGSGYGASGFPDGNRAILEFFAAETWTDSAMGTYITMSTTPTGSTVAAERMRITADGSILPPSDNTGSIGKDGQRWNLVRAQTVTSGDLTFENGVRATEEADGLAFMNPQGTKIALLDAKGNFHIKGKVMEDL